MSDEAGSAGKALIAGRYRLLDLLGGGGMGVVWRAKDETLGRVVAVKELRIQGIGTGTQADDAVRRAQREARIAASLNHPNVIGVFDAVEHEGRPWLIMEYLASRSLAQALADGTVLPVPEAARIGARVAAALAAAHDVGIVHRDVKPGNVLLSDGGAVKLTDFGISRAVGDTTVTSTGMLIGTASFMAPEVVLGGVADARSDVFALGATLYLAVEGELPYGSGDNAIAVLYRVAHEQINPPRQAGELTDVLLWMLARDPADRPTMPQVRRALEAVAEAGEAPQTAVAVPAARSGGDAPTRVETAPINQQAPDDEVPDERIAAPAPVPVSEPAPVSETAPETASAPGRWSRRRLAAIAVVAFLIAGAAVLTQLLGNTARVGGAHLAATGSHSPSPSPSTAPVSHQPSAPASKAPSTAAASTAASTAPSLTVAQQLTATITDYYKLLPGNLNAAWPWMTADYQVNHAGGMSGYESFWSQIQQVNARDVTASPPSTVQATIEYFYKNGTKVVELTRFGLVQQQGQWKIASSSVLSSRSG